MGTTSSRPYGHYRPAYTYVLPTDSFIQCPGHPSTCYCPRPHFGRPRRVFLEPTLPGYSGRRRYLDPMQYLEGLTVQNNFPGSGDMYAPNGVGVGGMGGVGGNGVGVVGGFGGMPGMFGAGGPGAGGAFGQFNFPYGGFGGLGWKDPRDWTTRDFDCLQEVFAEMLARQRGRRLRRNDDDYGYGYGYDRDGGRSSGRDVHAILDLLAQFETSRRLHGVETTILGTEPERRDAAFRQRLYSIWGNGGDSNDRNIERRGLGIGDGGIGNIGARFGQQQRDHERRERERELWNLDREVEEVRRHLERVRNQGGRASGGIGGAGVPAGWRVADEWPF